MGKEIKFVTKEEEDEAFLASIRLDPEAHAQALARKDATADPLAKVVKATKQQRPREVEPFLLAGVKSFARGVKVLDGAKELATWAFILHRWRIVQPEPVAVTNTALAEWHVDRRAKRRAIRKLTSAGLLEVVGGRTGGNPRVVPLVGTVAAQGGEP